MRTYIPRSLALPLGVLLALTASTAPAALAQDPGPTLEPATADACVEPEATRAPLSDRPLSIGEEDRIALFDGVWAGIRDYYFDPETKGLDWDAIGDEYARFVIQTDNAHEVYELLREMVDQLDDPYTSFYSADELGRTFDPTYGGIGALLDTSAAGQDTQGLRIMYVFDGGSAKDAGIGPRDRIIGVEGDPCARIVDIRGPEGTEVTLTVVSPGEEPRDLTLERRLIDPGILPEARRLGADPGVGYLRVLAIDDREVIDGIEQALTVFMRDDPIDALVLDLRGTDVGAPLFTAELLATFVEGQVGEYHSRIGNEPIEIIPDDLADEYADVPVVVLIDERTEAYAEQVAAILQDQGRATIVGQQTSGQTHGTTPIDFDDGSLLQIVAFGFQLPDGRTLEGLGVTPDVEVDADWLAYPESEDPMLLAALEVIEAERTAAASPSAVPATSPSPAPTG